MGKLNKESIIDNKYGRLTVLEYLRSEKKIGNIFLCRCDCGKETEVRFAKLQSGGKKSCGCLIRDVPNKSTINIAGKRFNNWTVLEYSAKNNKRKMAHWKCRCDCGTIRVVCGLDLRNNSSKSCGCLKSELIGNARRIYHPEIYSARIRFHDTYSDGNLSFDDFLILVKKNCYYCNSAPTNKANSFRKDASKFAKENGLFICNGLDKIDPKGRHDLENILPCCKKCNFAKSNHSVEDFRDWLIRLYKNFVEKS